MVDRLSALLATFSLRSQVRFAGRLQGAIDTRTAQGEGHLLLLRQGRLRGTGPDGPAVDCSEPALLLFPLATHHRLAADDGDGAELVCAGVAFGGTQGNPVIAGLPPLMVWPLAALPDLKPTADLLFAEAFAGRCGHHAAVDRLVELLMIQLLRHLMQHGTIDRGVMAGLADPRLARAIAAMHDAPALPWSLERLAQQAGMSRARFAARFAAVVQTTPGDYLAGWRITVAQQLLRSGAPVKRAAAEVGYGSAAALSRAFSQRVGLAPSQWVAAQAAQASG